MRFEELKNLKVGELIEIIQMLVKTNALQMEKNTRKTNHIISNKESFYNTRELLNALAANNKELIQSNNKYIELHTYLVNFLKELQKYDEITVEIDESKGTKSASFIDYEECFKQTVSGKLEFNEKHPLFDDKSFRKDLYQYYIANEEYEKLIDMNL
ncbi:MAG: hypothetical protein MI922_01695 [Bacteroidales bacterium]|nr:hypothetical protein [Bacteroidales bacterium]